MNDPNGRRNRRRRLGDSDVEFMLVLHECTDAVMLYGSVARNRKWDDVWVVQVRVWLSTLIRRSFNYTI